MLADPTHTPAADDGVEPVGSLTEEAAALAAAVSGWLANHGHGALAEPCALLAEHLSGGHLLPDATCRACGLTDPSRPQAAALGHLHDAVTALKAAAASLGR